MFGMFEHVSGRNRPFIIEQVSPPNDQKRPSKLTRLACINCRISKLKCSGEYEGCQRCEIKQIECCYPRPRNGRRNIKRSQHHTVPSKALSGRAASQASHSSSLIGPQPSPEISPDDIGLKSMGDTPSQVILESNTEYWLSHKDFQEHHDVSLSTNVSEYLQKKESQCVGSWQSTAPAITATRGLTIGSDTAESLTASRGAVSVHTGMTLEPTLLCPCYSDAISTFDYIQTRLVWKPHIKTITPSELLQNQKKALSECEILLTCRSCTSQSKYITLIIVMCEYLLASMEGGCHFQASCRQWDSAELNGLWNETEENDDRRRGERRSRVVGEETSDRPDEESAKVMIGRWQLDNDDQLSVIQGLFFTRVVRLSYLVTKLERLVSEHQWSNEGCRIQVIHERCRSLSRQLRDDVKCLSQAET